MPQPVDLAFAFGLEPARAVEYFRSKGYAITFNWDDMAADAHARAFTVAKVARMDVLEAFREELDASLKKGLTLDGFKKDLEPRLKALGFWGKQVVERPDGTGQVVSVTTPHRLETIYRTNLQSSYMAGRYKAFVENTEAMPYWQYVAVMDDRTRPAHAAMNGKVFRFDDPIWKTCWPPNGYRCRCRVRALSQRDLEEKGIAVAQSGDQLRTFEDTDPHTGEVFERVSYKAPGMDMAFGPDRGFVGNQALSSSISEVAAARKAPLVLGAGADAALAEISKANFPAWSSWVKDVLARGVARGESRVVAYANEADRAFLEKRGAQFASGALELEDRLIVGRKTIRYGEDGVAIDAGDWSTLPLLFAEPRVVLYHPENGTLLYLADGGVDALIRMVVRPGLEGRKKDVRDSVRSIQRVSREAIAGAIRGGVYVVVRGTL